MTRQNLNIIDILQGRMVMFISLLAVTVKYPVTQPSGDVGFHLHRNTERKLFLHEIMFVNYLEKVLA